MPGLNSVLFTLSPPTTMSLKESVVIAVSVLEQRLICFLKFKF